MDSSSRERDVSSAGLPGRTQSCRLGSLRKLTEPLQGLFLTDWPFSVARLSELSLCLVPPNDLFLNFFHHQSKMFQVE